VSTIELSDHDFLMKTQAEEALRTKVANLADLVENTQDPVWSIDRHYNLLTLNLVFQQQFMAAYGTEIKVGMNHIASLPAEEQAQWKDYYERALSGDRFAVELKFEVPGIPTYIEVSFNPILTPSCKVTGVAVFTRNITDRKRADEALQQARDQMQAVLDAVPGCVSWFSSDLKYLGINRYLAATFHLSPEKFVGRELGFMEASPGFAEFVQEFFATAINESSVEIQARVDGQFRDYLIVAQKYHQDQAAVFVGLDITERKRVEEALRESQERYALAVRGANDGLWDWNLKTNEVYFSPRWKGMLGYREREIGQTLNEWFDRVHPEERDWLQAQITAHLEGLTPSFEVEHRMLHKDGSYRWILTRGLAVRDQQQIAYRMAGSQTDITERKRAEEQLLHDALHDGLTGLFNRALFLDRLGHAIDRARRQVGYSFAVLFLDLDHFKVVNDSLGHTMGDQLLIAFARRLENALKAGDTLARLGGDEFAILLEDIRDVREATWLAEKIHDDLKLPFQLNGQEVFTTVSIGIAIGERDCDRPEDFLRNADTAMYRAKSLGRSRHELFNTAMHDQVVARLKLETDLRLAVSAQSPVFHQKLASHIELPLQQFQLRYQPIICLKTGEIRGFESLVRWHHPEKGLISPADFIPVAEETGLIVPIGEWILYESCRQLKEWHANFPTFDQLSISVNLSSKQFSQADLVDQVAHALTQTQLPGSYLKLELTESIVMDHAGATIQMLQKLKDLDTYLLIDDFGTGYSSLSYLHQFPIDTVKIDQSFTRRLQVNGDGDAIVRAIIGLAHTLGMNIIAEGVETLEHVHWLKTEGAELGQGYFFAKPLTATEVEALLQMAQPKWVEHLDPIPASA
jgi:diguanylate cyclase (GGDEF)-like protein/PAS domain S-box-containing protein